MKLVIKETHADIMFAVHAHTPLYAKFDERTGIAMAENGARTQYLSASDPEGLKRRVCGTVYEAVDFQASVPNNVRELILTRVRKPKEAVK